MRSVQKIVFRISLIAATAVTALALTAQNASAQMYLTSSDSEQLKITKIKLVAKDSSRFAGSKIVCRDKILDRDPNTYGYHLEEAANVSTRGGDGTHVFLPASHCDKVTLLTANGEESKTFVMQLPKVDVSGKIVMHFATLEERKAHMGKADVVDFTKANTFNCTKKTVGRIRSALRGVPVLCVSEESNPDFVGNVSFVLVKGFN